MNRSNLLAQLSRSRKKRDRLERIISRSGAMINASFVKVYLGTRQKKRKRPNYYLSWKEEGKTQLRYVRKDEIAVVGVKASRWKEYKKALAQLVKVNRQVERLLREWGKERIDNGYKSMD